jgi:hypothetical protein
LDALLLIGEQVSGLLLTAFVHVSSSLILACA